MNRVIFSKLVRQLMAMAKRDAAAGGVWRGRQLIPSRHSIPHVISDTMNQDQIAAGEL